MSGQEILEIVSRYYPNAVGIVMTGSHLNRDRFDAVSDIDILVFSSQFSVVSPFGITENKTKFDFTQVPLYDIENILTNEKFDPRGAFLAMLSTGRIIKDTETKLIKQLQDSAKVHYNIKGYQVDKFNRESINKLISIKKEFTRGLDYDKRFLMLNEFVNLITQLESNTHSKWVHSGKHKANFLTSHSHIFLSEIIALSKDIINDKNEGNVTPIINYIDYYILNFGQVQNSFQQERCVFDIGYTNNNIQQFVVVFLGNLYKDELLKSHFQYFYPSPKSSHRLYRNQISLVFSINSKALQKELFISLKKFTELALNQEIQISLIPNWIYGAENIKVQLHYDFEKVARQINSLTERNINNSGVYDAERTLIISIIISSFIAKYLDLDISDVIEVNRYLCTRWILSPEEQYAIKSVDDMSRIRGNNYSLFVQYYKLHQQLITDALKKGLGYRMDDPSNKSKEYHQLIVDLELFLGLLVKKTNVLLNDHSITYRILNEHCKLNDCKKSLLYVLAHDELTRVLALDNQQIAMYLISMTQSLMNLRVNVFLRVNEFPVS